MTRRIARENGSVILYDDALLVGRADPALFDPATWADAPTAAGYSGGRGATRFIRHDGREWVLRHYHRGGIMGRVFSDGFLWPGENRTRCFREWHLLHHLTALGLPVPRPVAARYRRHGILHTQDLITVRIPGVESLSTRLARAGAVRETWTAVGACIARFHAAGVWHADLTAHNLQIDGDDRIFLLDFDRGRIRTGGRHWQRRNLERLHRSLTKISRSGPVTFSAREWDWLLEGYRESMAPVAGA